MTMSDYAAAPGLRQSALKPMARSAAHFKAALENPEKSTEAQVIGDCIHAAVFEPHLLENAYHIRPETYVDLKSGDTKPWNGNSNACKDWFAAHNDRHVLRQREHEAVIAARKAVYEHPAARAALAEGLEGQCLFCEDPETGVQLKCRADWLSGNTICDLKSTDDASKEGFARSVAKFGYDVQAAYYLDIANWLGLKKDFFLFICVEKEPPYAVAVWQLDDEDTKPPGNDISSIEAGRRKYRRWLDLYSFCQEQDQWPAYSDSIELLTLPAYALRAENQLLLA